MAQNEHSYTGVCRSQTVTHLFAFLCGLDVDLSSFLEGLSENVSNQRFTGDLHGHHVPGSFQYSLRSGELATHIIFGQFHWLSRELLSLVTLVAVSQIFSKLFWSQSKLFGQAICKKESC